MYKKNYNKTLLQHIQILIFVLKYTVLRQYSHTIPSKYSVVAGNIRRTVGRKSYGKSKGVLAYVTDGMNGR